MSRPVLVALSGLDGAGKSSQASLLASRLADTGHSATIHWMALGHNRFQRRVRRALASFTGGRGRPGEAVLSVNGASKRRKHHHPVVTHVWVTWLALIYGLHFRRIARGADEDVVIFDRYALDTMAQSRYFYAPDAEFAVARAVLRVLTPRPDRSYLLSVAPEVALARKQEQYDAAQLDLQARLLRDEADRLGVQVVDGDSPARVISDALITDTLSVLLSRSR